MPGSTTPAIGSGDFTSSTTAEVAVYLRDCTVLTIATIAITATRTASADRHRARRMRTSCVKLMAFSTQYPGHCRPARPQPSA